MCFWTKILRRATTEEKHGLRVPDSAKSQLEIILEKKKWPPLDTKSDLRIKVVSIVTYKSLETGYVFVPIILQRAYLGILFVILYDSYSNSK